VKFLLDFEGPADRSQTCQDSGGFVPVPADSEAFWQEREAARFVKQVPGAYLRVQTAVDSNPGIPDNRHCLQLIDSATADFYGGAGISAWTRVNDSVMNQPNKVYSRYNPPVWIPEPQEAQNEVRTLLYLHELADMGLTDVAGGRVANPTALLRVSPLPCPGVLRIDLQPWTGARGIRVHDVLGRLVKRGVVTAGSQRTELDVGDLRPGAYYVSVAGAGAAPFAVVR
jgi:hypothetical protein